MLLDGCRAVAVLDVNEEAAKEVAAEVGGLAYGVDVTDYDALEAACRDAAAQLGGLTTLFNNPRAAPRCRRSTSGTSRSGTASSG